MGRRGRRAKRIGATLLSAEGEKQGAAAQRPLRSASVPRAPNRKEGERDERAGEGKDKEAGGMDEEEEAEWNWLATNIDMLGRGKEEGEEEGHVTGRLAGRGSSPSRRDVAVDV